MYLVQVCEFCEVLRTDLNMDFDDYFRLYKACYYNIMASNDIWWLLDEFHDFPYLELCYNYGGLFENGSHR